MKDKKLLFDRKCHVLYSRSCKKEIRAKIALHDGGLIDLFGFLYTDG